MENLCKEITISDNSPKHEKTSKWRKIKPIIRQNCIKNTSFGDGYTKGKNA